MRGTVFCPALAFLTTADGRPEVRVICLPTALASSTTHSLTHEDCPRLFTPQRPQQVNTTVIYISLMRKEILRGYEARARLYWQVAELGFE